MKKILSVLCVSMIFSGARGAEVSPITPDMGVQEIQVENPQVSRLKRMLAWVEQNKACLTGCSDWASFLANYTLGAAIQLGQGMILSAANKIYTRGFKGVVGRDRKRIIPLWVKYNQEYFTAMKENDTGGIEVALMNLIEGVTDLESVDIAGLVTQRVFIAGLASLTQKAIDLSYKTIIPKTEPLSWKQTVRCLADKECTLNQRRRAFFTAGRVSGVLGVIAFNLLRNYFFKKPSVEGID